MVMKHAGKDQKIEMNENQVYGINTSQTPDNVIEMKANQVYGVSDALHGRGEIRTYCMEDVISPKRITLKTLSMTT